MKRLRKFLFLKSSDRQRLIKTFILLGLVRLGLRLLPFQTLQQLLASMSQVAPKRSRVNQTSVGRIIWAVNVSSRFMPGGAKCLARALTTQVLLSRQGHFPVLRIGVAKGERGQLEAHAWVESQGQVVMGYLRELSRFIPLPSFQGSKL